MQIYQVGGAVRDRLLGREVTEVDYVVVGARAEDLLAQGFRPVGADFPVFLHPQSGEEYALARTERKSGRGYGGFTFHASPEVTLEEDLQRRDLTVNAMAEDDQGKLVDPYGGQRDLADRVLRHVSPAFAEDPLRVLRVARFAARYAPLGFRVAEETLALMRQLAESGELQALTAERAWKEISRALLEPRPEVFIEVLQACGALHELMPEIETALVEAADALQPLRRAADEGQPLAVRWGVLLGPLVPPHTVDGKPWLDAIARLGMRFKVPRDCQELATLLGEWLPEARQPQRLSLERLYLMLQRFDVYRRPQRLEQFIAAARLLPGFDAQAAGFLEGAAQAVRGVQAASLVARGFKGAELGRALEEARLEALNAVRDALPTDPQASASGRAN